jgi:hypothetical protein
MSLPGLGDWVEVYFWNADRNKPVYLGIANEIRGMTPKNFDGFSTTHVLFEDPDNKVHIKYNAIQNSMEIGNSEFQPAARKEDETFSDSELDSSYWAFFTSLKTYLDTTLKMFLNTHTHIGVLPGGGTSGIPASPFTGTSPDAPTSLTGKINSGSDQVSIGGA